MGRHTSALKTHVISSDDPPNSPEIKYVVWDNTSRVPPEYTACCKGQNPHSWQSDPQKFRGCCLPLQWDSCKRSLPLQWVHRVIFPTLTPPGAVRDCAAGTVPTQWCCLCLICRCPGSCLCRPFQSWVWEAPESAGRKHSHSEVFLSLVLLMPNQFLQLPSVISSHFCSSCLSFQLFCHKQRCQHPLNHYRKVRVQSPSWKKEERTKFGVGLFVFFLAEDKCLSEITRRGLEVICKLIRLWKERTASNAT